MSAQLLICTLTVFTLFLLMVHVTCMARLLSRPTLDCLQMNRHAFLSLCLILLLFFKITMHTLQLIIGQSKNEFCLCQKKTKWWRVLPEGFANTIPAWMGPIFVRRGRVISGLLADRFGSWFGMNTKLLHGVMGPISTPNGYLNTVFDDAVSLHGSCKTMPSHRSTGKVSNCYPSTECTCFTFDWSGWVIFRIKKIIDLERKHLNLDLERFSLDCRK